MKTLFNFLLMLFAVVISNAQTSETRNFDSKYTKKTAKMKVEKTFEKMKEDHNVRFNSSTLNYKITEKKSNYDFVVEWFEEENFTKIFSIIHYQIKEDKITLTMNQCYFIGMLGGKHLLSPTNEDKSYKEGYYKEIQKYFTRFFDMLELKEKI